MDSLNLDARNMRTLYMLNLKQEIPYTRHLNMIIKMVQDKHIEIPQLNQLWDKALCIIMKQKNKSENKSVHLQSKIHKLY